MHWDTYQQLRKEADQADNYQAKYWVRSFDFNDDVV